MNHVTEKDCNKNYDDHLNQLCITFQTDPLLKHSSFETLSILHHLLFTNTVKQDHYSACYLSQLKQPVLSIKPPSEKHANINITLMFGHRFNIRFD